MRCLNTFRNQRIFTFASKKLQIHDVYSRKLFNLPLFEKAFSRKNFVLFAGYSTKTFNIPPLEKVNLSLKISSCVTFVRCVVIRYRHQSFALDYFAELGRDHSIRSACEGCFKIYVKKQILYKRQKFLLSWGGQWIGKYECTFFLNHQLVVQWRHIYLL